MQEPSSPSIGERIRQLRLGGDPQMTQRELAERAGVSVDLISKLEQGRKQTALLVTLHKIARALDVDVSVLLAHPRRIDLDDGDSDRGVVAIRRAVTAVGDDADPAAVGELAQQASYAWSAYWSNRFDLLAALLPGFITTARGTARQTDQAGAFAALSDAYGVAASMLVHLGHVDLAYLAMERAIGAASGADDPLRRAALSGWMSWLLLHHTGGADQAQRLAVAEADELEPKLGKAPPERISVWGGLLVSGAVAAARDNQPDVADDMLNLAETAATRLQAGAYEVELAGRMPREARLPLAAQARHLADVASAQTSLGRDREATEVLVSIERAAPAWMRYQPYPRAIVRELLERERRARTPALRGLARRLGVA